MVHLSPGEVRVRPGNVGETRHRVMVRPPVEGARTSVSVTVFYFRPIARPPEQLVSPSSTRHGGRLIAILMILAITAAACGSATRTTRRRQARRADHHRGRLGFDQGLSNEAQFEGEPRRRRLHRLRRRGRGHDARPGRSPGPACRRDIALAIYDPLITFDARRASASNLATKWTGSDDLKTWTIKLRDDVKPSDGTPVQRRCCGEELRALQGPDTKCTCAPAVVPISKIEATDPTTVVFTLSEANAFFPSVPPPPPPD